MTACSSFGGSRSQYLQCHIQRNFGRFSSLLITMKGLENVHKDIDLVARRAKLRAERRRRWPVISAALFAFGFWFSRSTAFSKDYALCSSSSDIYTVDEGQPRVECIAISGGRIIDTGTQSEWLSVSHIFRTLIYIVDVRARWSDRRQSSIVFRLVDYARGGLKSINVKTGSIVVPGLAGTYLLIHHLILFRSLCHRRCTRAYP